MTHPFGRAHLLALQFTIAAAAGVVARVAADVPIPTISIRSGEIDSLPLPLLTALTPALCWSVFRHQAAVIFEATMLRCKQFALLQIVSSALLVVAYLVVAGPQPSGALRNAALGWALIVIAQVFSFRYTIFLVPLMALLVCALFGRPAADEPVEEWAVFTRQLSPDTDISGACALCLVAACVFFVRRSRA